MSKQIEDALTGITYHRNETKRKIEIGAQELHRLHALDDVLSQAGAMIIELGGESVPKHIDPSDTNPNEMRMVGLRLATIIQEHIDRKIKCGYVITEQALHEALDRVRKNALSADLALDSQKPIGSPQEGSPQNDPTLATRGLETRPENHAGDGQPSGLPAVHGSASSE